MQSKRKISLEETILNIEGNLWTTRDACTGTIVFGMTGSGKSSGPLYTIAHKFLTLGYGGVVFCAKPDECATWEKYAKETNRTSDLIYLSKETFNYLDHESKRTGSGGGQIENLVNLYLEIVNMGKDKKSSGGSNDEYWQAAVKQLLRNSMTLLQLGGEVINITNIHRLVVAASQINNNAEVDDNLCLYLLDHCSHQSQIKNSPEFLIAHRFFSEEFANLDERTKSNTVSAFSVTADSMQRGELARCFSAQDTSLDLESIYKEGKILIVDYDQKSWGRMGQYAAGIIKYCFEMMIERRKDISDPDALPVFLWADECQFFAIDYDQKFQTTARSSRTLTVYATQNLGNLFDGYGKEKASSLIGNLGTKIFCQNGEFETNEWASKSIGQEIVIRKSKNYSDSKSSSMKGDDSKNVSMSVGYSEQKDYRVDPSEFSTLQTGGPRGQCKVGFIFWQSGRVLNNGSVYVRSTIEQQCRRVCGAKLVRHCPAVPEINAKGGSFIGDKRKILPSDWAKLVYFLAIGLVPASGFILSFTDYDILLFYFKDWCYLTLGSALIYFLCLWFDALISLLMVIPPILRCYFSNKPRNAGQKIKAAIWSDSIMYWLLLSLLFTFGVQYWLFKDIEIMLVVCGIWFLLTLFFRFLRSNPSSHIKELN